MAVQNVRLFARLVLLRCVMANQYWIINAAFFAVNVFLSWKGYYGLDPAHMKEFWVLCALVSAMAVWRHRANIKRLMEGTENKLWGKKE